MSAILAVFLPFLAGGIGYFLGGKRVLVHLCAALSLLISGILLLQIPVDQSIPLLGFFVTLTTLGRFVVLFILGISLAMIIYSLEIRQPDGFLPCLCFVTGSIIATQLAENLFLIAAFLELAALIVTFTIPVIAPNERTLQVAAKYLSMMALAGFLIFGALLLVEGQDAGKDTILLSKTILALLSAGFGILIAVAPLHLWLPDLGEHTTSLVTAMVVCLLSIAAVAFLLGILDHSSWLLADAASMRLLQIGAAVTAVLGGILALGQERLGRLAAYTAIHGIGFVLLGITISSGEAIIPALFLALVQPVMLLLLFFSVGSLIFISGEDRIGSLRGIGRSAPVAAIGFLVAGVGIAGYPPLAGFAGKWLIYTAVARVDTPLALVVLASSGLILLAYIRAFHVIFFGRAVTQPAIQKLGLSALTTLLVIGVVIILGVFPGNVFNILGEIAISLSFVKLA